MQPFNNIARNHQLLADILKNQPATTHIYFRREDDVLVDIPVAQAEFTINRKPNWQVQDGAFAPVELAIVREELPVIVPPRPSDELPPPPAAPITDAEGQEAVVPPEPLPVIQPPADPFAAPPANEQCTSCVSRAYHEEHHAPFMVSPADPLPPPPPPPAHAPSKVPKKAASSKAKKPAKKSKAK